MSPKIIVFDLYNTLIKIEKNHHFFLHLYKLSKDGFGLSIKVYKELLLTQSLDRIIETLPTNFENLLREKQELLEKELQSTILFEGTKSILEKLAEKYSLFLISNLASPYKKPFFDLGLVQYFEEVIFSCEVGLIKPQIEIFQIIEEKTKEKEILMIGDSEKDDIAGAKAMNWHYLRIDRSQENPEPYVIADLSELNSFLK